MIKESSKRLERSIEHVIQLNNNINNMLYAEVKNLSSTNISTVQYYKLIQVCKDLKLLSNNIEFVSLFYIIFNKHNKVITNGKIYDSYDEFFRSNNYEEFNTDYIYKYITDTSSSEVVQFLPALSFSMDGNKTKQKCITLITRLHGSSAAICAVYNLNELMSLYDMDTFKDDGFFCIMLPNDIVLTSDNFDDHTLLNTDDDEINYKSKTYRLVRSELASVNGSVFIGISKDYFNKQVLPVKTLIQQYYIFAIVAGIILAILSTIYIYKPIYNLVKYNDKLGNVNLTKLNKNNINEFRYLYDIMEETAFTNKKLNNIIVSLEKMLHESLFNNILFGTIPATIGKDNINQMFPELLQPYRICVIDSGYDKSIDTAEIINSAVSEVLKRHHIRTVSIKQGQLAFIVKESMLQKVANILFEINALVMNSCGSQINAVLSNVCSKPEDMHNAFQEVQLTGMASNSYIAFTPKQDSMKCDIRSLINIDEFMSSILKGDSFTVEKIFKTSINNLIENGGTYNSMCHLFYAFRSALIIILFDKRYSDFNIELPLLNDSLPIEAQFDTLCELSIKLTLFSEEMINSNSDFNKEIIEYIENNYCDSNMYTGLVADKFGISTKQVYRIVRKCTGMGFTDYINKLRMERAQRLLKESDSPIKNISEECGFCSTNTFYKAFKKYYGMSPSKYVELIHKQNV